MKKLSLNLDQLRVETFATDDSGEERGTVRGHAETDCCTISCEGTCGAYPDSNLNALAALTRPPAACSQFCCA